MSKELGKATDQERDDGLRRGFDALDVEHTGQIPVEKFKERIQKVSHLSRAETEKMITLMNENGDGVVTFEEYKKALEPLTP